MSRKTFKEKRSVTLYLLLTFLQTSFTYNVRQGWVLIVNNTLQGVRGELRASGASFILENAG